MMSRSRSQGTEVTTVTGAFYAPVVTNASSRGRRIYGEFYFFALVVVFMCAFKYKKLY